VRARIVTGCLAALVIVVAVSWLVGSTGSGRFDWGLAATFGTAVGTTLLALSTGGLAVLTAREVGATQQLAALARDDQRARERPIVVVHAAAFLDADEPHIGLQVFNAGLGPAFRVRINAAYKDPEYQPEMKPALWPVIVAGGRADFAIQPIVIRNRPPNGFDPDGFEIEGTCLDRSMENEYRVISEWRTSSHGAYGQFDTSA
jgi:hypothetical protein